MKTAKQSRVLILTTPIGGGHTAVARAAATLLEQDGHEVVLASPLTSGARLRHLGSFYAQLVTSAPLAWSLYYHGRARFPLKNLNAFVIRREILGPLRALELESYDAVLLTSSVYAHCIEEITDRAWTGVVVTDLFDGPPEWFLPGADAYVVPSEEMQRRAIAHGIDRQRIWLRRLPTLAPKGPRSSTSDGPRDCRDVLIVGGTEGFGPLEAVSQGVSALSDRYRITVICGHNQALLGRLHRRRSHRFQTFGYVPDLATWLDRFDLVLTKPGSATIMELLDSGRLFALMPGIPGIETGNERRVAARESIPVLRDSESAGVFLGACFTDGLALSSAGRQWAEGVSDLNACLPATRLVLPRRGEDAAAA